MEETKNNRIDILARHAGLELTLRSYPEEVAEAARKAAALAEQLESFDLWPVEVWPAMRAEVGHD